jgi:threonine aldolase
MVLPHSGIICHRSAHIETSECGAPGFYTHGAKLMLADGEGAKLSPGAITGVLDPIKRDVHRVQPAAVSITQATELGRVYATEEVMAIGLLARDRKLWLHMDGARFANAVAFLGCTPAAISCDVGVHALSFGFVKNAAWARKPSSSSTKAWPRSPTIVASAPGTCSRKVASWRRRSWRCSRTKLWLENALAANEAAAIISQGARERLLEPVEGNQLFLRMTTAERARLPHAGLRLLRPG